MCAFLALVFSTSYALKCNTVFADEEPEGGELIEEIDEILDQTIQDENNSNFEIDDIFGDEEYATGLIEISPDDDEFDIIRKRLRTENINRDANVDSYIASMLNDGSWPGGEVLYTNIDVANTHLTRLMRMAREFDEPTSKWYRSRELADKINRGLLFWYDKNIPAVNEWWKLIGAPQIFVRVLTLMYGFIDNSTIEKMCELIYRMKDAGWYSQGTNVVWICTFCVYKGALLKDRELILEACDYIWDQCTFDNAEGLRVDGSYIMHGDQLYNNGYANSFLQDISKWIIRFEGTEFETPQFVIENTINLVLEGNRWMRRGYCQDVNGTAGRGWVRDGSDYDTNLAYSAQRLAELDTPYSEELTEFANAILENRPTVYGNKHFWAGDYMSHQREDYSVSVKACGHGRVRTEMHDQENCYGHWIGLGGTAVYTRGDDYSNIYQYWDFGRLPGITSPHREVLIIYGNGGRNFYHDSNFVGGVSNGEYGAEVLRLDYEGTKGNKAWFFFDDEFVSLGSDIVSVAKEQINTTVDQRFMNGDVEVDGKVIARTNKEYKNVETVYHDSIGYVFPDRTDINIKNLPVTDSMRNIGTYYADYEKKTADIFTMWFNHGTRPSKGEYAYITVPAVERDEFAEYSENCPIEIIENSASAQCVYHNGLGIAQMFVYKPKTIEITSDLSIKVKQAGGYMISVNEEEGTLEITVSDPCQKSKEFDFEVIYKGKTHKVEVKLPQDKYAGQSVMCEIAID